MRGKVIYIFEAYSLDAGRRELRRESQLIPVEPQVFDLLQYLLINRDRVISKDDLITAVWGGRIVSDSAITSRITAARQAIGDSGGEQRLIRTVPRKGFRFIGEVREEERLANGTAKGELPADDREERSSAEIRAPAGRAEPATATNTGSLWAARLWTGPTGPGGALNLAWPIAAAVLLVATGLAGVTVVGPPILSHLNLTAGPLPVAEPESFIVPVAVLPFSAAVGNDAELSADADRATENLTNYLSRVSWFSVVASQPDAEQSTSRGRENRAAGSQPHVHYVLKGTMRAQDETLRLNVSLIDVRSGLEVWSDHFAESRSRWPSVHDDVFRRITYAVHMEALRRLGREPSGSSRDPTVGQLFARGWTAIMSGADSPLFNDAREAFTEALRREPDSARLMVGLAAYYVLAVSELKIPREPHLAEAEALLRRALAMEPRNHSVHFYLGVLLFLQRNLPAALQAFDRTVEINPSFPPAYARRGRTLIMLQRYPEALENIRYALRLNGATSFAGWSFWAGLAELELGYDQEARQSFQKAIAVLPDNPYVRAGLAGLHALKGEWREARDHVSGLRNRTPQLSDEQRLFQFNAGPDGKPLPNRLGEGLRLALEAQPVSQ